jgi:hypothetical protein
MIKTFACRDTEKLFNDQRVPRLRVIEKDNTLSALTNNGVFASSGMMAMRLMLKLSTIIEVKR